MSVRRDTHTAGSLQRHATIWWNKDRNLTEFVLKPTYWEDAHSTSIIPNTTKTLQRTTDMICSIVSPASKVKSIPPTLAGLVEVSLVVQQLNHTLQMRKQLACESTALHALHYGNNDLISSDLTLQKNPFTSMCGGEG